MSTLRVAAIQFRTLGDRAATLRKASALIEQAAEAGAELVVLPEAFTGLYGVGNFASNAEIPLGEASGTAVMASAAAKHKIYVCGGVIESCEATSLLHNTVFAFGPDGEEAARYRKLHLSKVHVGADRTSEGSVLTAGDALASFNVNEHFRVGLLNCFDLRFATQSSILAAQHSCNVLLYPAAWLKSSGEMGHWDTLLRARALDNQCFVVGADVARDDSQEVVCFGHTCIIDPLAQTMAMCRYSRAFTIHYTHTQSHLLQVH
jgi:predicted amidohydrolase